MIFRLASLLATACLFGGCSTLPQTPTTRGLELNKVVNAIQCELARVYLTAPPHLTQELDNFVSKAELELRILNSVNASAEATVIVPISASTGTFTPSAGMDSSAGRISNLKFYMSMKKLRTHECAVSNELPVTSTSIEQAPHNLGLTEWVIATLAATGRRDQADLDTMSYAAEFIVTPRAGGSLGFEVVNWSPKAKMGLEFKDTQALTISFARISGPGETRVRIVNWPGPMRMLPVIQEGAATDPPKKQPKSDKKRDDRNSQGRRRAVPLNPNTEYKLERENWQNKNQSIIGVQRPIGF